MNITSTDPKDPKCCVLVYNDGMVIVQQCNIFQETSTIHTLETFETMEDMQNRVDELNLEYPENFNQTITEMEA